MCESEWATSRYGNRDLIYELSWYLASIKSEPRGLSYRCQELINLRKVVQQALTHPAIFPKLPFVFTAVGPHEYPASVKYSVRSILPAIDTYVENGLFFR